jgi:ABC-type xylose transport system permease subunit
MMENDNNSWGRSALNEYSYIGGASLAGRQDTIFVTVVGALIMTIIANGCTKMEMPNRV